MGTRVAVLRSQQVLLEISTHAGPAAAAQESGGAMEMYDKLFVAFNDALESIRADLRALSKEQTAKAELSAGRP